MTGPPRVCTTPRCPQLTTNGTCDTCRAERRRHQAQQRRTNGDPSMDVYSTTRWRTIRARHLRQHPQCSCGAPAHHVDHIAPRRILLAAGIHQPDDHRWLQSLCEPCHNRKTRTVDAPLLRRLANGEPPDTLASQALNRVGYTT